jgi:hypothetical protein
MIFLNAGEGREVKALDLSGDREQGVKADPGIDGHKACRYRPPSKGRY